MLDSIPFHKLTAKTKIKNLSKMTIIFYYKNISSFKHKYYTSFFLP